MGIAVEGKRLIRKIRLVNLLSYGPTSKAVSLQPLNVLIGPNASGKSNLIEALMLLASTPDDLRAVLREGGGVAEWPWKGKGYSPGKGQLMHIEVQMSDAKYGPLVKHAITLLAVGGLNRMLIRDEEITIGNTIEYSYE
jgi:predicted ATPase